MEEDGCYFVALCLQTDFDDIVFPVSFHTKDHKEALKLVRCITDGDPRKRLLFADPNDYKGFLE